jgi:hypothetical protein
MAAAQVAVGPFIMPVMVIRVDHFGGPDIGIKVRSGGEVSIITHHSFYDKPFASC